MISKEYLSFTKRERRGIITLVFVLIIVALMPKFFCNPKPVAEKLPDKAIEQLSQKRNENRERKDTVYIKKYISSKQSYKYSKDYSVAWSPKKYTSYEYDRPRLQQREPIDINTADTTAFIALPGIGSKLANRIVSFRKKLGGFNSIEQIKQVYGLQDSVYQLISPRLTVKL